MLSVLFLKRNIKILYQPEFRMKYGFIYQEYRKECYYMEFVKTAIKVTIIIVQSIYVDSIELQVSIIQQILTIYLVVTIIARPYNQHSANGIEIYNIFLCLMNMILVNSIYQSEKVGNTITTAIFLIGLLVINVAFIIVFAFFLFKQKMTELIELVINLTYLVITKFPRLKSFKYMAYMNQSSMATSLNKKKIWQYLFVAIKDKGF